MQALFDAFGLNVTLLIAQAVNFGLLMVALWYFLYKPITKVVAERQMKIAQGVEDATLASQKLAAADSEAAGVVQGAETKADEIVGSAREAANAEKARIVKDAEARAARLEADAAARAKEDAARTLLESEKEVARLAVLAASKVLEQKA